MQLIKEDVIEYLNLHYLSNCSICLTHCITIKILCTLLAGVTQN